MTKKNNTNKIKGEKTTILQILDGTDVDSEFYRDILRYIIGKRDGKIKPEIKNKDRNEVNKDNNSSNTEFRVWELSKWLLKNNRQLRDTNKGSKKSTYSKTHSKIQNVSSSLNKLIDLDLIVISKEGEPSLRNPKIPTKVYDVTLLGMLIASLVEFKILTKGTSEYKEALESLLKIWIIYIPPGNKEWGNYNYHFLKGLIERCKERYDEVVLTFLDSVRERAPDLIFNFGELRSKVNNMIFKKLIRDDEFRKLYFSCLNEFYIKNKYYNPNIERLIKFQFKLDVETHYERRLSQLLNFSSNTIQTFQYNIRSNNNFRSYEEAMKSDLIDKINSEIVFDYNIKNQWEQIRNENLLNCDKITILLKCKKCSKIYPFQLEIAMEIDNLSAYINRYESTVELYDIENDVNALYLKGMLSNNTVI